MGAVTTFLDNTNSQLARGVTNVTRKASVVSGSAASGDNVQLFTVPPATKYRLVSAIVRQSATLGASATVKLQVNRGGTRSDITGATTAGAASQASSAAVAGVPYDLQPGDIIEALVGGAAISASAEISADLLISRQ